MSRRRIHIDKLGINLKGVDAGMANRVSKLLPGAISRQLQINDSTSLSTDQTIVMDANSTAEQLAQEIAAQVAGTIRTQT